MPEWRALRNPEKQEIHRALLNDQHYVCVYCGKQISEDFRSSHIEHFYPQSVHTARRFDWQNLFASCGPTGQAQMPETCGDKKKNWDPSGKGHIDPIDPHCEERFAYDGNGTITPSINGDADAQTMIDTLNLDDDSLCFERLVIISDIEARIDNGSIIAANKAEEIALWRTVLADGKLIGYGHVAARYLEDQSL